jgi:protein ImuA
MKGRPKSPIQIEALRRQIARLEGARHHGARGPVVNGCGPLDRLLPERGFCRGTLVEWLAAGDGSGAATLALGAARAACRDGGALVVLDHHCEFYPPAAVRAGIEPHRLIVVHAADQSDNAWALDQALRCPGVAAVLAWPEQLDGRTFRRLQLAAEEGGGLGLLIRPDSFRHEPSWAHVRLLVEPLPAEPWRMVRESSTDTRPSKPDGPPGRKRWLRIHLLRCRGAASGRSVELEIDDETRTVHLAARLADPTAHRRAAGA